ncbi:zinc ribbon domain-containing protein [Streptomyces sp. NPDC005480]|uniref:zinc ribbon domain-containing protein n=1 Tax=Streptomyces sp. NPDC005480 TaxID=3154880 RepID=UPI0033B16DC2
MTRAPLSTGFATPQTCPACKKRDPKNRLHGGREFACVHCGHVDHGDRTASLEIEARARRMGDTVIKSTRSSRSGGEEPCAAWHSNACSSGRHPVRGSGHKP